MGAAGKNYSVEVVSNYRSNARRKGVPRYYLDPRLKPINMVFSSYFLSISGGESPIIRTTYAVSELDSQKNASESTKSTPVPTGARQGITGVTPQFREDLKLADNKWQ